MLLAWLLLSAGGAPPRVADTVASAADTTHPPLVAPALPGTAADTIRPRPRAIEYSDEYYTRLTIHRYGSYAMVPMFAGEYVLGNHLLNDLQPASWLRPAHLAVATGLGTVFAINTVTGLWNLWDSRQDPESRTLRVAHSLVMLASDAGMVWTATLGASARHSFDARSRHRNVALGTIGVATLGSAMMWFLKQ